jgi:hypothetical protein
MRQPNWRPWTDAEIIWFLAFTDFHTAEDLAARGGRSIAAIMGMRRKLWRLREVGANAEQLPQLLRLSEPVIAKHELRALLARTRTPSVKVKSFVRRSRFSGNPEYVDEYERSPGTERQSHGHSA